MAMIFLAFGAFDMAKIGYPKFDRHGCRATKHQLQLANDGNAKKWECRGCPWQNMEMTPGKDPSVLRLSATFLPFCLSAIL